MDDKKRSVDAGYSIRSVFDLTVAVDVLKQNQRIGHREIGWVEQYHVNLLADGFISTFTG